MEIVAILRPGVSPWALFDSCEEGTQPVFPCQTEKMGETGLRLAVIFLKERGDSTSQRDEGDR